jgi:hypothetical protein
MAECAVWRTPLRLRLWFYIVQGLQNTLRKNLLSMANGGINFFYCHQSFFTCKSRYECSARLFNCAKTVPVRNSVINASISSFFNKYIPSVQQIFTTPI